MGRDHERMKGRNREKEKDAGGKRTPLPRSEAPASERARAKLGFVLGAMWIPAVVGHLDVGDVPKPELGNE
jgi:hypothetical protein